MRKNTKIAKLMSCGLGVLNVSCKSLDFSIGDTEPVKILGHVSNKYNLHFTKTNIVVTKQI